MKVALVMLAVNDLGGSGGAERHFTDLFEFLRRSSRVDISVLTDRASIERLRQAGRLSAIAKVIVLSLGASTGRGWQGVARATIALCWAIWRQRFDVVHICLPTPTYVPFAAILSRLPRALRPRLTMSVIDCTVAPNLTGETPADLYEQQVLDAHRLYFRWTRVDGAFTWYRQFADVAQRLQLFASGATVTAARYCFTHPERFVPAERKENLVLFAGRLSTQKRPLLFVDAVATLRDRHPQLTTGWRFAMYGQGPLEREVRERIETRGLASVIELTHAIDMAPVFATSRLLVSTQAFENFTSLAMLEAMAAGNAVIAEQVGQTADFVQHGVNGLLVDGATPEAFAAGLAKYLLAPDRHRSMAAASRAITTDVHTIDHAASEITAFWQAVARPTARRARDIGRRATGSSYEPEPVDASQCATARDAVLRPEQRRNWRL